MSNFDEICTASHGVGAELLRIDLLLSFVVCRRNDTFILMFLVHHFELGYSFIGLVDALPAEVALTVDPSRILCIVLSLTPHIVCAHELLHDFIVFLMSTSLWMHLLEVGSMLVESCLSVARII